LETERATRFLFSTGEPPPENRLAVWLEAEPQNFAKVRNGKGDFAFSWVRQFDCRNRGENQEPPLQPVDGILLVYGAPGFAIEGCTRLTNVRLDGALLRSKIPDIDQRLLHLLPSDSVALRLLQAYVDALRANGIPADPVLAHGINEHLVDLIAACLRTTDDDVERAAAMAIPTARLAAAKTDIRVHLADPTLSARHVAQRLGLSERSICLLFERGGLSFASFVTEERLKRATAMLVDPARTQQRIGDIALAAGFGDLSTFNRSFRRRYGRTPSSLRRPGSDQPPRPGPHETD
jgi:AraC-like DNA-binding protein